MLSVEENEMLTRVGAGTPVGELMRRYWHPVATSQEIKQNPVKGIRLLGESLTLFRDRQDRLGLIDQRCAHRRVDLKHGIPENDGLRCPYHGGYTIARASASNSLLRLKRQRSKIPSN